MRSLVLLPLAVVLCGCPPPMFSVLQREPPPVPVADGRAVADYQPCPVATDTVHVGYVVCTPDAFNAHVASRAPSWVAVRQFNGRVVRGRSIQVRNDTAVVGRRAVPMASVDHLWLVENYDAGSRLRRVALSTGVAAGTVATLGAIGGAVNPERTAMDGALDGFAGGAIVGLGFGLLLDTIEPSERFVVRGWHDPALAPDRPGLLVASDADVRGQQWGRAGDTRCGEVVPLEAGYVTRCTPHDVLTTRAGADWVDEVSLQLRDGGHLQGQDLLVTDTDVTLDGVRQPLGAVSSIELRSVDGAWSVVRPAAKGALVGMGYGLAMGAGYALATGDTDGLWVLPVGVGTFFGATGLTLGLVRGRVRVRDVTFVPAPGP